MTLTEQRTVIESGFMSAMAISSPDTILIGENADVPLPSIGSWIRMSITIIDITYPCLGTEHEEIDGIFNVQVFIPLAQGVAKALTIIDNAKTALRGTYDKVAFRSFDMSTGQAEADWYSITLRATYRAQN